jgi:Alw26I/Eco31I/Esp3I family type II restriction endonuclease
MTRKGRKWDEDFLAYMEFIVDHANYEGMPEARKEDGTIQWVTTGKSELGRKRSHWWEQKAAQLGIVTEGKWISATAKRNHPTKMKVCQTCGRKLSIEYVYPTKNLIKRLNNIKGFEAIFNHEDLRDIREIVSGVIRTLAREGYAEIRDIFDVPRTIPETESEYLKYIYNNVVRKESRLLSPGAMSNAPDRLDGFHTYNICCRSDQDTGRHEDNLSRYGEDRRAYQYWSDGDWKTAGWLMRLSGHGKCYNCPNVGVVTADHIGPISLGFAHLPRFQPLCRSCNSAKNNRMFLSDVKKLIELEEQGEKIISWHSQFIWDSLKVRVATDLAAKKLSRLMRTAHHYLLETLYMISVAGHKDFLINYLNPDYARFESIEFIGINPSTFEYESISKVPGTKTQYENNEARYVRIAFESLEEYHNKENRNILLELSNHVEAARNIHLILKKDNKRNRVLSALFSDAFNVEDKDARTNRIKVCLEEWKKDRYMNLEADHILRATLESIALEVTALY